MATTDRARAAVAQRTQTLSRLEEAAGGQTIGSLLDKLKPQLARALPSQVSAERFTRIVLTEIRRNPRLLEASPESLFGAVLMSAQLGLEPGQPLGLSWLVPFRDGRSGRTEITWMLGYRGMIELAWRSGRLKSIAAHEVCEGDDFEFAYGLEPVLRHRPAMTGRGGAYAYYGCATFVDGGSAFVVLSREDVEGFRKRSKASGNGPWVTDFDAMARKTCIRRLAPWLPLSAELARAIATDDSVIRLDGDDLDVAQDVIDVQDETADDHEAPAVASSDGPGSAAPDPGPTTSADAEIH